MPRIPAHRAGLAGVTVESFDRLSVHAFRVGFITEACDKGVRDENIMRHIRHRELRIMHGYVQCAGLLTESPAWSGLVQRPESTSSASVSVARKA